MYLLVFVFTLLLKKVQMSNETVVLDKQVCDRKNRMSNSYLEL